MFLEHTGIELIMMLLFLQMCSLFENTQYGIKNIIHLAYFFVPEYYF